MATVTATGSSTQPRAAAAATEAVRAALAGLAGKPPLFGFLFAASRHRLDEALAAARELAPGCDFLGCTTAGEITERGLTKGGMCAMLVASDECVHDLRATAGLRTDFTAAANTLCAGFSDAAAAARSRGYVDSTTVTLIDGLSGVGEKLVAALIKSTRPFHQIVGGAAGDDGKFKATFVGGRKVADSDAAAALHVFGPKPWGVGVDHGLRPSTAKMIVTRASANVVHELDGKPAFEVYQGYAKQRGVTLTP